MSKSSRTSHSHAGKAGKRATVPAAAPDASAWPPRHPWGFDGIDDGPTGAVVPWGFDGIDDGPTGAVVHDLVTRAFDLAERDVADWPEGQRRIRTARRFVLAHLRGKRPRAIPVEDVLFTTGVFVRLFETELQMPMSDLVAMLDQFGFPTEDVPLGPRAPSAGRRSPTTPIAPLLRSCRAAFGARTVPGNACDGCSQRGSHFRSAA